jgi:RNA polymerase primary sigma factor
MKRELRVTNQVTHKGQVAEMHRREVQKTKPMDPQTEYEVAMRARSGDKKAREILIKSNLRFVLSMAKNFSQDPTTLDELIAAGNIGLVEAADRFDPTKGFKFISFAVWSIRKEMMEYLYENARTVKVSTSKLQLLGRVRKWENKFMAEHGRDPVFEEILEWVNQQEGYGKMDARYLQDIYMGDNKAASFDAQVGEESTLHDMIGEDDPSHTELFRDDAQRIRGLLSLLTPDEREIVEKVFGLNGIEVPISVLAEEKGRAGETIRLHLRRALKKMKLGKRKLHRW